MKNYLIIVEGAHDIAAMERVLCLNGISGHISTEEDLPAVWKHVIPARYPFADNRLDRITPIPSFVRNEEVSVAIKNAGSDKAIISTLQQMIHVMQISDIAQINGIMLVCDADSMEASDKRNTILSMWIDAYDLTLDKIGMQLGTQVGNIPLYMFVFPDDNNSGNLENLLLETAAVSYPDLLSLASEYINNAKSFSKNLGREQDVKKATIGCIANTMKPGKANQVSIAGNEWITEETMKKCTMLAKLDEAVKNMLKSEENVERIDN